MSSKQHPVLARLLSSNAQWARDVELAEPGFFQNGAKGQSPQVLWIGCADSRVPESVVLATKPGEIFVTRNIANQFHLHDDSVQSVLAYAVTQLGVSHVIIVGHSNCGGAAACRSIATSTSSSHSSHSSPDSATPLGRWLGPLVDLARSLHENGEDGGGDGDGASKANALKLLVDENVKMQVNNLSQSDIIQNAWKDNKHVYIHGWVYELETGRLRDLQVSQGPSLLFSN